MKLREWQAECIAQAHAQYESGQSHFLCLATPGAGKTRMAALLAKQLIDQGLVDLVMCFAPSVVVVDDFRSDLEGQIGQRMDGLIGSRGCVMTYHAMLSLPNNFWSLFAHHRVFVIFDEIHHCAGANRDTANAWGERIICEIQGRATYSLALTGTPWRSDSIPIVLSRYGVESGEIHCDYQYGLSKAINDHVCRIPHLIAIDNDNILLRDSVSTKPFSSFKALLENTDCSYQQLIEQDALIKYLIGLADKKLMEIRRKKSDAGGLIVAASVVHAQQIARLLKATLGENALVVTHYEDNAVQIIRAFKSSAHKWIISVGMVSEGTNIPRLQVCCYLTRVKTELYFRQVLGRVLRASGQNNEAAYLYLPAEPILMQYATRIADDIPHVNSFEKKTMRQRDITTAQDLGDSRGEGAEAFVVDMIWEEPNPELTAALPQQSYDSLSQAYDATINLFGQFRHELLSIGKSFHRAAWER